MNKFINGQFPTRAEGVNPQYTTLTTILYTAQFTHARKYISTLMRLLESSPMYATIRRLQVDSVRLTIAGLLSG
jgi:hypothetical protein